MHALARAAEGNQRWVNKRAGQPDREHPILQRECSFSAPAMGLQRLPQGLACALACRMPARHAGHHQTHEDGARFSGVLAYTSKVQASNAPAQCSQWSTLGLVDALDAGSPYEVSITQSMVSCTSPSTSGRVTSACPGLLLPFCKQI